MNPIEKNCFIDVKNHSDKVLMISIQILVQRFKNWAQGRDTQPLQSKEIKISSNRFDSQGLPKSYQAANSIYQISKASTFVQWAKSIENIPDKRFPTANQRRDF
jgi:hypothetical protein